MKKSWSIQSCCQQSMEYLQLALMGASPGSEAFVIPYFSICSWRNVWIGQLMHFYKYFITHSSMDVLSPSEEVTQCITITWGGYCCFKDTQPWQNIRILLFHFTSKILQNTWLWSKRIFSILCNTCFCCPPLIGFCCSVSILNLLFTPRKKKNIPHFLCCVAWNLGRETE